MRKDFIAKLETEKFLIGSFDVYEDMSMELIKRTSGLSDVEAEAILKSMPISRRSAITDKEGQYIGYIGLFNVDDENGVSSIRFETKSELSQEEKSEILEEFKKYLADALNIKDIAECIYKTGDLLEIEKKEIVPKSNIFVPNKMLVPGISLEVYEHFLDDYKIPSLQMPFTIKSSDKVIGIIGLSNVIWSNRRANLSLFLEKSLGSDIIDELSGYIIDDYIDYVHQSNIHNVMLSVNGSNNDMLGLLDKTKMNYFGEIPFSSVSGKNVESSFLFQHLPNMKKEKGIIVPNNTVVSLSSLDTDKRELDECIELGNGFKLVAPKAFEKENIDWDKVLDAHIKAMQNREGFSIPLGEDKYILQKGNGDYGVSRVASNFSYIILNDTDDYSGYINILRSNADRKNAEIEIAIAPSMQQRGLGTQVINRFYDELFSVGYASVTSAVFEFNNPSIRLHEKVAELNGVRLDSYYINGKLWDMRFYSKVNGSISGKADSKNSEKTGEKLI